MSTEPEVVQKNDGKKRMIKMKTAAAISINCKVRPFINISLFLYVRSFLPCVQESKVTRHKTQRYIVVLDELH